MKFTIQLKNLLTYHQNRLSGTVLKELESDIRMFVSFYLEILQQFQPGPGRARKTHQLLEEQNKAYEYISTTCAKGCGACCHLEVEITADEAQLLARVIESESLPIDRQRLENQARRQRQDEAWRAGATLENRCVFLDEASSCRVYSDRPLSCRKHAVVSPAAECLAEKGEPVPRIIPMNEIIVSAVINLPRIQFGSLSKMLLQALDQDKEVARVHQLEILEQEPEVEKPRQLPEPPPLQEAPLLET